MNVNDPASGSLKITGDRTEGKTLTADTSGIEDKDGLPAGFNDYIDASLDDDCIGLANPYILWKLSYKWEKAFSGVVIFNDPRR